MIIFKIILLSLGSITILFILTKLMGNKQISQLSMFDYITGITIGSIAAEMATSLEDNFLEPLVAMIIYSVVAIIISVLSYKSLKLSKLFSGYALILLDNGEIYIKNLKKAKLDIYEFLMLCRINGYFNINDLQTAILESNGQISFIPKSPKKPVLAEDINLSSEQENLVYNVIIDGKIQYENLKHSGNDELWLKKQLDSLGIQSIKDVFLCTCDINKNISVYKQNNLENKNDLFY